MTFLWWCVVALVALVVLVIVQAVRRTVGFAVVSGLARATEETESRRDERQRELLKAFHEAAALLQNPNEPEAQKAQRVTVRAWGYPIDGDRKRMRCIAAEYEPEPIWQAAEIVSEKQIAVHPVTPLRLEAIEVEGPAVIAEVRIGGTSMNTGSLNAKIVHPEGWEVEPPVPLLVYVRPE